MSKNIAAIVGDGFEDSEYSEPAAAFGREGHRLVNIGIKKGDTARGKTQGTEVTIDKSVEESTPEEFDALLIPGGRSPGNLRKDENAVSFVRDFVNSGKPVFSICHGPQLLVTAGIIKGRKATGYKSIRKEIEEAGGEFIDREVVTDGALVFSRDPGDIPAFIRASLDKLG